MKRITLTGALIIFLTGCSTRSFTNTPRTAIEQLLLSAAVDNAVQKINIPQITSQKIYLDFSNLKAYDAEYIRTAVASRFAQLGAVLVEKPENADYIAGIACGALGTEYKISLIGIPSVPIPGSPTPSPELALARSVEQTGIAKLLIFVHSNGKAVASGQYYGKAERDESFILLFRFQKKDDIRSAWEKNDGKLIQSSPDN